MASSPSRETRRSSPRAPLSSSPSKRYRCGVLVYREVRPIRARGRWRPLCRASRGRHRHPAGAPPASRTWSMRRPRQRPLQGLGGPLLMARKPSDPARVRARYGGNGCNAQRAVIHRWRDDRAGPRQVITACRDSAMIDWARSPQTAPHWRKSCLAVRTQVCLVPSPFLTRTTSSLTCAPAALRFSGASAAHL